MQSQIQSPSTSSAVHTKICIATRDLDAARSVAGLLAEVLRPEPLAISVFEALAPAHRVEAYYDSAPDLAHIAAALVDLGVDGVQAPFAEDVPDANWVTISQKALPPIEAGRFVVHGSHDRTTIGHRLGAIEIDAGEAFGTAHHATTLGCLHAIDRLTCNRTFRDVLDLGCGSGVLAIAAGRVLPHARVTGSDIDAVATDVATANARRNRMGNRVRFVTAVGLAHPALRARRPFDLIIANILARPLVELAPALHRATSRGGRVVLSGLLVSQAAEVIARYRSVGFVLDRRDDLVGWSILTLRRGLMDRGASSSAPCRSRGAG